MLLVYGCLLLLCVAQHEATNGSVDELGDCTVVKSPQCYYRYHFDVHTLLNVMCYEYDVARTQLAVHCRTSAVNHILLRLIMARAAVMDARLTSALERIDYTMSEIGIYNTKGLDLAFQLPGHHMHDKTTTLNIDRSTFAFYWRGQVIDDAACYGVGTWPHPFDFRLCVKFEHFTWVLFINN